MTKFTTEDLRKILHEQIGGVIDGSVSTEKARSITGLSQQIYNTMLIEIRLSPQGEKTIMPVELIKNDAV